MLPSSFVRICRLSFLLGIVGLSSAATKADPPAGGATGGKVTACEHFAFGRASISEGLGGPMREALKSWDGERNGGFGPDGSYYHIDVNNSILFRIRDGQARIMAGTGVRGHRDGPADQARFDFGVGSYSDADVQCDAAGRIYLAEAMVGRLRRIERRPDGQWWVATIAGGGDRMPRKGESVPAQQIKQGCSSRFALTPEGTVYFASYGGIYRIKDGEGTLLISNDDIKKSLGDKVSVADWHVGGSHITAEQWFYWMPGGGPDLLRFNVAQNKVERVAGIGKTQPGLDGPSLLESGFHTVLVVYAPDASTIYTCGGDESVPRRIAGGVVTSLHRDGTFRPHAPVKGGKDERWREMAAVQCLDEKGRLYACTGDYGWGGWIVRFTFEGSR